MPELVRGMLPRRATSTGVSRVPRVSTTEAWMSEQSARGLIVTNYAGDAR